MERKFEYASPELWARVEEILARPDRITQPLRRGVAWVSGSHGPKAIFRWPAEDLVQTAAGDWRPKGTRADTILVSNMQRAIRSGRTDLAEVRQFLTDMFGKRARNAWDEPWRNLDEAIKRYGGELAQPKRNRPLRSKVESVGRRV